MDEAGLPGTAPLAAPPPLPPGPPGEPAAAPRPPGNRSAPAALPARCLCSAPSKPAKARGASASFAALPWLVAAEEAVAVAGGAVGLLGPPRRAGGGEEGGVGPTAAAAAPAAWRNGESSVSWPPLAVAGSTAPRP